MLLRPSNAVDELGDLVVKLLSLAGSLLGKIEGVGAHHGQTTRHVVTLCVDGSLQEYKTSSRAV